VLNGIVVRALDFWSRGSRFTTWLLCYLTAGSPAHVIHTCDLLTSLIIRRLRFSSDADNVCLTNVCIIIIMCLGTDSRMVILRGWETAERR